MSRIKISDLGSNQIKIADLSAKDAANVTGGFVGFRIPPITDYNNPPPGWCILPYPAPNPQTNS